MEIYLHYFSCLVGHYSSSRVADSGGYRQDPFSSEGQARIWLWYLYKVVTQKYMRKLGAIYDQSIWLDCKHIQMAYFFSEKDSTIFLHARATCSEWPNNIGKTDLKVFFFIGSGVDVNIQIQPDPDPKHWVSCRCSCDSFLQSIYPNGCLFLLPWMKQKVKTRTAKEEKGLLQYKKTEFFGKACCIYGVKITRQ